MVALFVVVVIIGILIRTAITHASTYYLTVAELHNEGTKAVGEQATVSGEIVGSTVNWNPGSSLLKFTVKDTSGNDTIPVVFHGAKPDDFSNNWPVIVTGTLKKNGSFQASKLLIKCPSKYQAKTKTIVVKSS
jgi:cytochrome c-type biogenesis protein CcmE